MGRHFKHKIVAYNWTHFQSGRDAANDYLGAGYTCVVEGMTPPSILTCHQALLNLLVRPNFPSSSMHYDKAFLSWLGC